MLVPYVPFAISQSNATHFLASVERVTYSILACRVVLHIREQGEKEKQLLFPSELITGPMRFVQATQRTGPVVTSISGGFDGGP